MGTLGAGNHYAEIQVGPLPLFLTCACQFDVNACWPERQATTLARSRHARLGLGECLWGSRPASQWGAASTVPPSFPCCPAWQVVDEVFDRVAARKMGIDQVGQVCIMIHSGSRGLGHQVGLAGMSGWQVGGDR